jgi:hypothetical protein
MERNKSHAQKWGLFQYSEFLGYYDVVVIAHNGKCADRLLSTAGSTFRYTSFFSSSLLFLVFFCLLTSLLH